jgi:mannose-6-phosphate isomerase-like protein (cupin superfamily)
VSNSCVDDSRRWTIITTGRREVLGGLAVLAGGLAGVRARTAASAGSAEETPEVEGTLGERLIDDVRGTTDRFGRIPISRLVFDAGAVLPEGFLTGPLVAIVESGEFEVETDTATVVGPGDRLDVPAGTPVSARNTTDEPGSWLVLLLVTGEEIDVVVAQHEAVIYSDLAPEDVPVGLEHLRLTRTMDIQTSLLPVRFTVERVSLAAGESLESLDLDGPTPRVGTGLIVESGSVQVIDRPNWDPIAAGDDTLFGVDENFEVQALGDEPAVFLVVRLGEDDEEA